MSKLWLRLVAAGLCSALLTMGWYPVAAIPFCWFIDLEFDRLASQSEKEKP